MPPAVAGVVGVRRRGTVYVNAAVVRGDHRAKKVAKGEKQPFWVMTPDGHDSAAVVVEI